MNEHTLKKLLKLVDKRLREKGRTYAYHDKNKETGEEEYKFTCLAVKFSEITNVIGLLDVEITNNPQKFLLELQDEANQA